MGGWSFLGSYANSLTGNHERAQIQSAAGADGEHTTARVPRQKCSSILTFEQRTNNTDIDYENNELIITRNLERHKIRLLTYINLRICNLLVSIYLLSIYKCLSI